MRNTLWIAAIAMFSLSARAAASHAAKAPASVSATVAKVGNESVKLTVVGYRSDGIDTSRTDSSEQRTLKISDIKSVSHASSWYYAVELSGGKTLLAKEIAVDLNGKTARFEGDDRDPPAGTAASLEAAARQRVSSAAPKR